MKGEPAPILSCSSCGVSFCIPGRVHGFSHCDTHRVWTALPEWEATMLRGAQ